MRFKNWKGRFGAKDVLMKPQWRHCSLLAVSGQ